MGKIPVDVRLFDGDDGDASSALRMLPQGLQFTAEPVLLILDYDLTNMSNILDLAILFQWHCGGLTTSRDITA